MRSGFGVVDWRGLGLHGARTTFVLGAVHVPPAVVGIITTEWIPATTCLALVLAGGIAGWVARGRETRRLALKESLFLTTLVYPAFTLAGALVFWSEVSFDRAFFEAASGYTTTGLSVFVPERLPVTLWFYRAWIQWVGGIGVLMLGLGVIQSTGRARVNLFGSQLGPTTVPESPGGLARRVVQVYLLLSIACAAAYWLVGIPIDDALYLAMTTVSTAGFAPRAESVGAYAGFGPGLVAIVFMLVSAVSFPLWSRIAEHRGRELLRDVQARWLVAGILLTFTLVWVTGADAGHPTFVTLFHIVSAATTTGLSLDPDLGGAGNRFVVAVLMTVGGAGGSTVGGLKLWRLILLVRLVQWWITRQSVPREAVLRVKLMGRAVTADELQALGAFLFGFAGLLFLSAWALMLTGSAFDAAFFEAASALGNAGLSSGLTNPDLSPLRAYILCVAMWCGRLEVLPVLYLMAPRLWYGTEHRT